jgi:homoserine O-acetyltransferase
LASGSVSTPWNEAHRLTTLQHAVVASEAQPLALESGTTLAPVSVAYETYGTLNAEKSNAILVCHALTGDAHLAGKYSPEDTAVGWWDTLVGEGKALDPTRDFIICSNVLGGCKGSTGPSSLNPATGQPYAMAFPVITIGDMVQTQARLLDALGISQLKAILGGSMGGFQALDFAVRYPQRVRSVAVVASSHKLSAQAIAFNAVARFAILNDPQWQNGDYPPEAPPQVGLSTARMMAHLTYLSEEALEAKFGRRRQNPQAGDHLGQRFDFTSEFAVESYLAHQGQSFLKRFDANTYLYMTKALDYFDLAATWGEGSLLQALARSEARFFVAAFESDWRFPTACSQAIARALRQLNRSVAFVELPSTAGHDAFLLEHEALNPVLGGWLQQEEEPQP